MRPFSAVEIGADTCALVRTSMHGAEQRVSAAEILDPAAFPGLESLSRAIANSRRTHGLPRRCRAVVWGLPDGATRKDPAAAPLIEPLTRAGFKVERVVTPCNALGALARLRVSRSGGAMCWLGINRAGVAIAVVRPGRLLYSHSFPWDSNVGASGSQARLLQRYSLVAFLAPEVRRAIAVAHEKGTTVDGLVTCGNLPDLRSLTMPLIEELDVEVETLDSLEGLLVTPQISDRLAEAAAAFRLACAAATARGTRVVDENARRRVRRSTRIATGLRVAAVAAAIAAVGYGWYARRRPAPPPVPAAVPRTPAMAPSKAPASASSAAAPTSRPPAPAASGTGAPATAPPPASPRAVGRANPSLPPPAAAPGPQAVVRGDPGPATASHPVPQAEAPGAVPKTSPTTDTARSSRGRPAAVPIVPPRQPPPARAPAPSGAPAVPSAPPLNRPAGAADKQSAAAAARPGAGRSPLAPPLKDPVPRITAILVSGDRRLAAVGEEGRIVAVGDRIGRRVVVGIDERTVVLREPSGVQIRVALGGRLVGPGR